MSGKKQSSKKAMSGKKQQTQQTLTTLFQARSSRPQVQLTPKGGKAKGVRGPKADAFKSPAQVDTFKEYTEAISGMYGGPVA
jgi:hypothetical protein